MIHLPSVTLVVMGKRCVGISDYIQKHFSFHKSVCIFERPSYIEAMEWELFGIPEFLESDHCMFCSDDGFPVNFHLWNDDFLKYDMIGAPWPDFWKGNGARWGENRVGNTGFCIRSKKFLQACKDAKALYRGQLGDVFSCQIMHKAFEGMGIKYAPVDVASRFSWEHFTEEGIAGPTTSFGFHGWVAGKTPEKYNALLQ